MFNYRRYSTRCCFSIYIWDLRSSESGTNGSLHRSGLTPRSASTPIARRFAPGEDRSAPMHRNLGGREPGSKAVHPELLLRRSDGSFRSPSTMTTCGKPHHKAPPPEGFFCFQVGSVRPMDMTNGQTNGQKKKKKSNSVLETLQSCFATRMNMNVPPKTRRTLGPVCYVHVITQVCHKLGLLGSLDWIGLL